MTITTDPKFLTTLQAITGKSAAELEETQRRASVVVSFRYGMAEAFQQILASTKLSEVARRQLLHSLLGALPEPERANLRQRLEAAEDGRDDAALMESLTATLDALTATLRDAFAGGAR